mmetsp:Transcript_24397/g.18540  ORF Transcript_24397/g.18540 Transcript_24397/m.18540 type:complete len:165 (+) Transcript_24397:126-620(+)
MIPINTVTRSVIKSKVMSVYVPGIRFGGGGGGRPGGKPAFNWKEKKLLGIKSPILNTPRKQFLPQGIHLHGDFRTIEHLLRDIPPEDVVEVDATDETKALQEIEKMVNRIELERQTKRTQPQININSLFGSSKSVGRLPTKLNKRLNFGRQRVNRQRELQSKGI